MQFAEKLQEIERRFDDVTRQLGDPAVINDGEQYRKAAKAHSDLAEVVATYRDWKKVQHDLEDARGMLGESEPELRLMAEEETARLTPELDRLEADLKVLLLPK